MAEITFHFVKDQTEYINENKNRYSGQCLLL